MRMDALARRYAGALLQAAVDAGAEREVREGLGLVARTIADRHELGAFLRSPCHGSALKLAVMADLFGARVCATAMAGVRLIVARGRERMIQDIARAYGEMLDRRENRVRVSLVSARPLGPDCIGRVRALLAERLDMEVAMDVTTSPGLIGGCVISMGGRALDNSLRGRLLDIRDRMMKSG